MEVCDKCGLPKDLCVCEEIVKESQRIKISTAKRRFGKLITRIEGIDDRDIDLKELSKLLKTKCACGGTVKDGCIELQGDQTEKLTKLLTEMGYTIE
ncbi:MAG: stress response translation initiation inhibitor YciH [Candidatus Syntropharchaeia archaeon]